MTAAASAGTTSRTISDRVGSTMAALLASALWFGGMHLFIFFAGHAKEAYRRFEIPGGLPRPTQFAMDYYDVLASQPVLVHVMWAVAAAGLVAAAIMVPWRRAFRRFALLAVACFVFWSAVLAYLALVFFLPFRCGGSTVGWRH